MTDTFDGTGVASALAVAEGVAVAPVTVEGVGVDPACGEGLGTAATAATTPGVAVAEPPISLTPIGTCLSVPDVMLCEKTPAYALASLSGRYSTHWDPGVLATIAPWPLALPVPIKRQPLCHALHRELGGLPALMAIAYPEQVWRRETHAPEDAAPANTSVSRQPMT